MVLNNEKKTDLSNRISAYLEENHLRDLLEELDISPEEVILTLLEEGLIDEEALSVLIGI